MKHLLVCHGNWVAKWNLRPCCTKYEANLVLRVAEFVYCVKGPTGSCPFCEICRMFETKDAELYSPATKLVYRKILIPK
jgi:hypothetical protein